MIRKKKPTASLVRSSAAEYLTFVAATGTGGVEALYADENVWLSQKMMAQLYDVEVPTINYHLKKVFEDSELEESAVVRNFRITAADGKTYDTKHQTSPPSSPSATRSTPNARCSSASGPRASSRSSPSRASRWTTSASSAAVRS